MCVSIPRKFWKQAEQELGEGARYYDVEERAEELTLQARRAARVPEPARWIMNRIRFGDPVPEPEPTPEPEPEEPDEPEALVERKLDVALVA